jgi:glycerol transport system permease protein
MSDATPTTPEAVRQRAADAAAHRRRQARSTRSRLRPRLLMALYLVFVLLPIYWLLNMSFQSNSEILGSFSFLPQNFTLEHYAKIFTDSTWYMGYVNSILYVLMNMSISILVALPAAYAFSRFQFIGDKHLFFWLLTNLMAPPAVFLLPYFQLYYTVGLFDTHVAVALAHCLFNIPLAVWILEGFMSSVPKEIDETAFIDGYSFPRFFTKIFIPMIRSGIGVTLFFLFMFSWVELLLARTLTSTGAQPIASVMTRTSTASGVDWGALAAAGVLTILPGILVVYFVRNHIAKGFALGRT